MIAKLIVHGVDREHARQRMLRALDEFEIGGLPTLLEPEPPWLELARRRREREASGRGGAGSDSVVSPMQGTVLKVDVAAGDEIEAGTVVCVVEAMKMENEIAAHRAGTVAGITVAQGDAVASGQVICRVVADEA